MDIKISNDAQLHNNRAGAPSGEAFSEGDLVGLSSSGELVLADADSAVSQRAVGVALTDVINLSSRSDLEEEFKVTLESQRTLVGDRAAYADHGIDLIDNDSELGFTPGEPVYLAPGGGFTQTEPDDSSGELIQVVGYALSEDRIRLSVQF